jgi:serine/threonine protein kinase/WD40 repeat protein
MKPSDFDDDAFLARLLELPPEDRLAALQRQCDQDFRRYEALRERLALAEETSGHPRENAAADLLGLALSTENESTTGSRVGNYKLLQKIGEGGFGVVWMADQLAPIRRRVAVKIIKLGMDTEEVIARFEAERQALALMEHTNIARVFEAGSTPSGRPFFAMELVRGVAITQYCDENRLSATARLELFIAVCHAVQHAHQKGVIHRDLKPSNILVTLHDGSPVPKIIDFGIAKATSAQLTDKTLFTQFHAFIGTPAYTSPEQMEMSGLDVDTRSDIYSLGVLLYELLTGRPPFDSAALVKSGLEAMRRTIRNIDPPRPSARIGTLSDADRTSIAQQRGTDAGRLTMLMRGDLDWIVMHCLEKDRTRRYESASGLASDIQRHLANEPVMACPPSNLYRLQKLVRRHKLAFATALAVTVTLVAGLIVSSILLLRERSAHARAVVAEQAEGKLRQQAEVARQDEEIRASRTARDLAGQFLADGRTTDGLAYLVHAARKNPRDTTIAPRLASLLVSRNYLLPVSAPLQFPSRVTHLEYTEAGKKIVVFCDDGTLGSIDVATGRHTRTKLPGGLDGSGEFLSGLDKGVLLSGRVLVVQGHDGVIRVVQPETGRIDRTFDFGKKIARISAKNENSPVVIAVLEDRSVVRADVLTGQTWIMPGKLPANADVHLSPDGRWLSCSDGPASALQFWNLAVGKLEAEIRLPGPFQVARFSPDGTRVLVTYIAGAQRSGFQLLSLPGLQPVIETGLIEHTSTNLTLVLNFSPDGQFFSILSSRGLQVYASGTGEKLGPAIPHLPQTYLVTTERAHLLKSLDFDPSRTNAPILFGGPPDHPWVIAPTNPTDGRAGMLIVRDVTTGQPALPPLIHSAPVGSMKLSGDGGTLYTASVDGTARLWDLRTGELRAEPTHSHYDAVTALAPDGSELIVGRSDGTVQRLHVSFGMAQPLMLPRSRERMMPAPFLENAPSRVLWLQDDRARVLEVESGREVAGGFSFPEPIRGIPPRGSGSTLRPDLRFMVVQTRTGAWQSWALGPGGVTQVVPLENARKGEAWVYLSSTGETVAMSPNEDRQTFHLWDLRSGRSLNRPLGVVKPGPAESYTPKGYGGWGFYRRPGGFSTDGRRFATGSWEGVAQIWETASGKSAITLKPMRDWPLYQAEFNLDGTRIATNNAAGESRLWDAATGQPVGPLLVESGMAGGVRFSPAGDQLLTWARDGIARLWDSATGAPVSGRMTHPGSSALRAVAFSSDGRRISTIDENRRALVWDARAGQPIIEPLVHDVNVMACTFSPDGRYLRTELAATPSEVPKFALWSLPPDTGDAATPEWLLQLATVCAAGVVNDAGQYEHVPAVLAQLDDVRQQLAVLPVDAPFAEWGRWFLNDHVDRPIAPGFTLTPAEAEALMAKLTTAPVRTAP